MISYAQNFEDVILERIFSDKESGFYVDIGACHPVYDSVTYHFYLKGWSGINVEPQPKLFSELEAMRKRDTNLQVCVGAREACETLYITRDVGTSTLSRSLAESYRRDQSIDEELMVELVTLDQIWSRHVDGRQVDFMKIDVEGYEKDVLSGADFSKVAPAILIIEATTPNSRELCYEHWEPLILEYYEFFYFDGLNRFYSRKEYPLDKATFSTPPNVFDQFKIFPQVLLEQANESLATENQALEKQLQMSLAQLSRKDEALNDACNAYESLQAAFGTKEKEIQSALELLRAKESALANASETYKTLQKKHLELKTSFETSFQEFYDRQKESDQALSEATLYCESLAAQLQRKDDALADAAKAYQALKEEFDEKVREVRGLHDQICKITRSKDQ